MINIQVKIDGLSNISQVIEKLNPRLILFGETHGFFDDWSVQEKIIKLFKPDIFVYELLEETTIETPEDFKKFLSTPDKEKFSLISTYGELKKTVKLAQKYGMDIIGCDLKNMGRENTEFLQKSILTPEEEKNESILTIQREKRQAEIINRLLSEGNTRVFASIGAFHLLPSSKTISWIHEQNMIICFPEYKGKQEFLPEENMDNNDLSYIMATRDSYCQ